MYSPVVLVLSFIGYCKGTTIFEVKKKPYNRCGRKAFECNASF